MEELVAALPTLKRVVVTRLRPDEPPAAWTSERMASLAVTWDDFLAAGSDPETGAAPPAEYTRVPFAHPQCVRALFLFPGRARAPARALVSDAAGRRRLRRTFFCGSRSGPVLTRHGSQIQARHDERSSIGLASRVPSSLVVDSLSRSSVPFESATLTQGSCSTRPARPACPSRSRTAPATRSCRCEGGPASFRVVVVVVVLVKLRPFRFGRARARR